MASKFSKDCYTVNALSAWPEEGLRRHLIKRFLRSPGSLAGVKKPELIDMIMTAQENCIDEPKPKTSPKSAGRQIAIKSGPSSVSSSLNTTGGGPVYIPQNPRSPTFNPNGVGDDDGVY